MEDFLRNKLNEFGDANDNWDLPDEAVWKGAQTEIAASKTVGIGAKIGTLPVLLGGVILLLGGLGFYLKYQNNLLKEEKENLEIAIKNQETLIDKQTVIIEELKKEKPVSQNENLTPKLPKETQKKHPVLPSNPIRNELQNYDFTKLNPIAGTSQVPAHFEEKIVENEFSEKKNTERQVIENQSTNKDLKYLKNSKLENLPIQTSINFIPSNAFEIARTMPKKSFEIGYEHSFTNFKMPSEKSGEDWEEHSKIEEKTQISSQFLGLGFGWKLNENFRIKSGFRLGGFVLNQKYESEFFYQKDKEFITDDGGKFNAFEIDAKTPFSDDKNSLRIDVPSDFNIQDGHALIIFGEENQEVNWYQIPVGIQYFLSKKKASLFLETGIEWNKMSFKNYQFTAKIFDKEFDEILESEVKQLAKTNTAQFLAAYGSLGLNFELTKHWQVRAAYAFNYNFIKTSNEFSKADLTNQSVRLGVFYQF